jgi:hypothetical protein
VTRKALVSTVAIAAAVAVPVADAHTLSKSAAKREAAKVGENFGGAPVYQCTRRSDHVVVCEVSVVGLDGAVCVTRVRVAYRDRTRNISRRVISGPECDPPEIPKTL